MQQPTDNQRRLRGQEDSESDFASLGPNPVDNVPSEMLRRPLEPDFMSGSTLKKMNASNSRESEGKDVEREKEEERRRRERRRETGCATITLSVPGDERSLDGSAERRSE